VVSLSSVCSGQSLSWFTSVHPGKEGM